MMLQQTALIQATLAVGSAMASSVSCPANLPFSCSNTTAVSDLCCFNAPGGAILLTQFWDTKPATGPGDSWTLHGLWPDNCDGSYEANCDKSREYTNITDILAAKAPYTLDAMQTFWKDYQGDDESFWEHEWGKHGTCISTLEKSCYGSDYQATDEVADYFTRAVGLFKTLPTYDWLAAADIVPSASKTYTLAAIQKVLTEHHDGHTPVIRCRSGELDELWYHYQVQGSVQSGTFKAVDPVGSGSNCPATGIKYLPKYASGTPTTTTTKGTTPPTSVPVPTGTPGALSGKGYVNVKPDGFLISSGNWYRASGATPATYTATPSSDGKAFTLKSSKGPCQVLGDASLSCASGLTASSFGYDGSFLTFDNASTFYAASTPNGQDKGVISTKKQAVSVQLSWQAV
ncbi:ribonuclease T2-like protein [Astrocystis sublimbata]|nr:ribonuclease T2-like protein [Astrocystis sublimbata]